MRFLFLISLLIMACSPDNSKPEATQPVPTKTVKVKNTKTVKKAAPAKAKTSAEANVGDARYVIQFPASNEGTETTVTVRPLGDYKMNLEYPASLNLDKTNAPAPLAGQHKSPSALTEAQLKFVMPIKKSAGADKVTSIKATIDFSVCNAQACEMIEKEITWKVKSGS